jgi:hypothetical protein
VCDGQFLVELGHAQVADGQALTADFGDGDQPFRRT